MNSKQIEMLAVNRLEERLLLTNHIIPDIPRNDKSPSWDGEITVYSSDSDKKSDIIGKIRVQVKGKYSSSMKGKRRSFPIDRSDLINYKNDGGAILFVVFLNENNQQFFCNDLTAEKLKSLLKMNRLNNKKKISVPIFPMPMNSDSLTDFIINALNHCRMQTSFASSPIQTIQDFEKRTDFQSLELKFFGLRKPDPIDLLLNSSSIYWYGKASGVSVPIPLEYQEITKQIVVESVPAKITIDNKEYYDSIRIVHTKGCTTYQIGDSFSITQKKEESQLQVNITLADEIHKRLRDLQFILAAFDKAGFYINGKAFPLTLTKPKMPDKLKKQWQDGYKWCKDVVETFEILHCSEELCISKLSNTDFTNLDCLVDGIRNKNTHLKLNNDVPDISFMKVGSLHFLLHKVCDPESGLHRMEDFYASDIQMAIYEDETAYKITSQYDICTVDVLKQSSNVYLANMLQDYKRFGYIQHIVAGANNLMLNLISVFDDLKEYAFLDCAMAFSDWLTNAPEQYLDNHIKIINRLQIIKRRRLLYEMEKDELYSMIEETSIPNQYKVAAYALLDNNDAALHYWALLSEEEKSMIKDRPIEKLIKFD